MGTIADKLGKLAQTKADIKAAIAAKGQAVGDADTFASYAGKIAAIETGGPRTLRYIVGTSTGGWTASDCDYLCDGTADDTEINQAIQALPSSGGEIMLLSGTYHITAPIRITKSNVKLSGNGASTILKRMWNSTSNDSVIYISKPSVIVEDLTVDGNKTAYTSYNNDGVDIYYAEGGCTISRVISKNNMGNAIVVSSSNNNFIFSNICDNNGNNAIFVSNSNNVVVTGNTCRNNHGQGVCLVNASDCTVADNVLQNNGAGVYFMMTSQFNSVTGNICNGNSNGIHFDSDSQFNTVCGNVLRDSAYSGININGKYNTITGNVCVCGTGQASDYTNGKLTIDARDGTQNLIACNMCPGKAVEGEGATNTVVNNKS